MCFKYILGPFFFSSELELPHLRPCEAPHAQEPGRRVDIRLAAVGDPPPDAVAMGSLWIAPGASLLEVKGIARFLVRDGRTVEVEVHPGAPLRDVRSYLTGWVFGALCHQNGYLPLHASAVRQGANVTAFAADSGAGKSTLAACLAQRGYAIAADDVCLLVPAEDTGRLRVEPVAQWLKLHRESAAYAGLAVDEARRAFTDEDKFRLPLAPTPPGEELRLHRLIFLERAAVAEDEGRAAMHPLRPMAALERLLGTIYLGYTVHAAGGEARMVAQCCEVLRHAEAHLLRVPWGMQHMPATLDLLETVLRS